MKNIVISLFMILFLFGCTHKPENVRVYHYGTSYSVGWNGTHTVQKGDTLWSISKRYDIILRDLIVLNKVPAPYYLAIGQRLLLPTPSNYTVQVGDTLYGVSRLFHTNVTKISRLNNLTSPYLINVGDVLRVPSSLPQFDMSDDEHEGQTYVADTRQRQTNKSVAPKKKPVYTKKKVANAKTYKSQPAPRSSGRFLRPTGGEIISRFGPKKDSLHNDGINIRAPKGASIRSSENGVIVYADNELAGYGNLTLIKHADNYVTAYAHMDKILVQKGARVKRGEVIGTVGSTGNVKTPQLHFEVRRGAKALDPQKYMGK